VAFTLIQSEHLPAIAALSGHARIAPALLRRNLVVSGLPLVALKGRRFRIGEVLLEGVDECDPCSRMEDALGPGRLQRHARPRRPVRRASSRAEC
jgi:MOSC domain-containing protein YiiM